jgi:hypothetical protein
VRRRGGSGDLEAEGLIVIVRLARPFVLALALGLALATPSLRACAQSPSPQPDRRGEVVTDSLTYQGTVAHAPIAPQYHVRNEGGSDGQGLCVIASGIASGMAQGIPGLDTPGYGTSNIRGNTARVPDAPGKGSALWRAAKAAPGGYSPPKLKALLQRVMPEETWADYYGTDPEVLERWSASGFPINVTMNTGANYGYRRIAHMISMPHFQKGGYACVADNNFPGVFSWMPASEFLRRQDGGVFWAWIWTRNPIRRPTPEPPWPIPGPLAIDGTAAAVALLLMGTTLVLLAGSRRRTET